MVYETKMCDCGEPTQRADRTCSLCASDAVMLQSAKPRPELLDLALECGAQLTGKPDGSEPIEVVFSIEAWRVFDRRLPRI